MTTKEILNHLKSADPTQAETTDLQCQIGKLTAALSKAIEALGLIGNQVGRTAVLGRMAVKEIKQIIGDK